MRTYVFDCDYNSFGKVMQTIADNSLKGDRYEVTPVGPAGGNPCIRWTTNSCPEELLSALLYGSDAHTMEPDEMFQIEEQIDAEPLFDIDEPAWNRAHDYACTSVDLAELRSVWADDNWHNYLDEDSGPTGGAVT